MAHEETHKVEMEILKAEVKALKANQASTSLPNQLLTRQPSTQ